MGGLVSGEGIQERARCCCEPTRNLLRETCPVPPGNLPLQPGGLFRVVNGFIEAGYRRPGGGPEEDLEPEDPEPEDLEEFKKAMRWRSRVARWTFVGCMLDDRDIRLQLCQNPTVPAPAPILDAQSPAPH